MGRPGSLPLPWRTRGGTGLERSHDYVAAQGVLWTLSESSSIAYWSLPPEEQVHLALTYAGPFHTH